jgi:hypothetical protein
VSKIVPFSSFTLLLFHYFKYFCLNYKKRILTLLFEVSDSDFSTDLADYLTMMDFGVFFVYLMIIGLILFSIKHKNEDQNPAYKFFLTGFYTKILFGWLFTFIYLFYYKGGDAVSYFWSTRALSRLLLVDPHAALSIIFLDERTGSTWASFNDETTYPLWSFFFQKGDSIGVCRISSFFMTMGLNLWLPCLLLLNVFWYRGIWKFFLLVCKFYPGNIKWNAFCILFIPSVLFWGSGIMKDSFTLAASLWLVTNLYYCFIERYKFFTNFLMLLLNSFILVSLKPYVFVAIIPAALVWISFLYIKKIQNKALKLMATPGLLAIGMGVGLLILKLFASSLGTYGDTQSMLNQAQVVQQDLVRGEQYGQNYYDIGKFDASIGGVLKKAPMAIIAGLYRPFLWEARNPVMLISGLENFVLLIFSLFIIFRIGLKAVYKVIVKEPLILFCFIFSLIFAFSVGLATANFGALVRYRILAIPFFLVAIINTFYLLKKQKLEKSLNTEEK